MALIIAPVITSARSANMGWRTVWIPIAVAVSIAVGLSPILFIVIGGFAGWWWLARMSQNVV